MNNYLLEILTEEIPARFMDKILIELYSKIEEKLKKEKITYNFLKTTGTHRRIVLILENLKIKDNLIDQEIKGPRMSISYDDKNNKTNALLYFMRKHKIENKELTLKIINNVEYVFAKKYTKLIHIESILKKIIEKALIEIYLPKRMYWGKREYSFIRPVKNILSLYNNKLLKINFVGIESVTYTFGHRFLSPKKIIIKRNKDYFDKLKNSFVIVDKEERKNLIIKKIKLKEKEFSIKILISEDLLKEILFLIEYPTIFIGNLSKKYLKIPKEIIRHIAEKYQKCFLCQNKKNKLSEYFIGIRCGNDYSIQEVIKGNEKVLKSKLEDINFFYKEDRSKSLLSFRVKLKNIVFQEKLGSIDNKVDRLISLSKYIGNKLFPDDLKLIEKTALLSKCDLATQMVYEFPELQGIIGSIYSSLEKEDALVSRGIVEHYMPTFSNGIVPSTETGIVVSLADKIDTLIGIMGIGKISTGSEDPYSLRRISTGIVRIIIENKIFISIEDLIMKSMSIFKIKLIFFDKDTIINFLKLRVRNILEKFLPENIINSLLKKPYLDIYDIYIKAKHLHCLKEENITKFEGLIKVLKRVFNIIRIQKNNNSDFLLSELKENEEIILGKLIVSLKENLQQYKIDRNYKQIFISISNLEEPLNNFFEKIIVNDIDSKIKNNRVSLLNSIFIIANNLIDVESI